MNYGDIATQINQQYANKQGDYKTLFDRLNSQFITDPSQMYANPLMKSLASQEQGHGKAAYQGTLNNQLSSGFGRNSFTTQLANEARRTAQAPYQEAMASQGNALYNQGVQIAGNLYQNEATNARDAATRQYQAMLQEEKDRREEAQRQKARDMAWVNAIIGGGMTAAGALTGNVGLAGSGLQTMAGGNYAGNTGGSSGNFFTDTSNAMGNAYDGSMNWLGNTANYFNPWGRRNIDPRFDVNLQE